MFNSFVRSLTRALRTLLEVTSLNMLLRHDARRARDDLLDVNLSLPFQTEVNTGFGVLAKVYLDALTHINGRQRVRDPNVEGVKEAKQMALDICEETFQGVKYPKAEVERGFRFWDVVSPIFPSFVPRAETATDHERSFYVYVSVLMLIVRIRTGVPALRRASVSLGHPRHPTMRVRKFHCGMVVRTRGCGGGASRRVQTLTAMRQLHSEGAVLRELIDQFEAAEAWLAPMRP